MQEQKTLEELVKSPAQQKIVQYLRDGLSIKQAAEKANMSYGYARNWVAQNDIKSKIMQDNAAETPKSRADAVCALEKIAFNKKEKPETRIKAFTELSRIKGYHGREGTLETPGRQHELDQARRTAARQLAVLHYKRLPPVNVNVSEVKPAQENGQNPPDETPFAPNAEGEPPYPSLERKFSGDNDVKRPEYQI